MLNKINSNIKKTKEPVNVRQEYINILKSKKNLTEREKIILKNLIEETK